MPYIFIPGAGLMRAPLLLPRDSSLADDERQWQEIEKQGMDFTGHGCRPKYTRKPHPRSYRPDIPLVPTRSYAALCTLSKEEKARLAGREIVRDTRRAAA